LIFNLCVAAAGVREVPDTDGGRFDGDPSYDRAFGAVVSIGMEGCWLTAWALGWSR
jgi:hypothetical protein